jgi:hypothetical protein
VGAKQLFRASAALGSLSCVVLSVEMSVMQTSSNHSRPVLTTMCLIPYLKQPGMQSWNLNRNHCMGTAEGKVPGILHSSVSQGRELPCMESRPGCTPQLVHGKQAKGGPRCECVCQFSLCCKKHMHACTTVQGAKGHKSYQYWKRQMLPLTSMVKRHPVMACNQLG